MSIKRFVLKHNDQYLKHGKTHYPGYWGDQHPAKWVDDIQLARVFASLSAAHNCSAYRGNQGCEAVRVGLTEL